MVLFYSGSCGSLKGVGRVAEPEVVLRERATIMLSYALIRAGQQEQHKRFPLIVRAKRDGHRHR